VEIQIRDLDQTVIGNPAHDLIRLGLSLATASRGSNLSGVITAKIMEQMIEGYGEAMIKKDGEPSKRPETIQLVIKRAIRRSWKQLARERIQDSTPTIPLDKRSGPLCGWSVWASRLLSRKTCELATCCVPEKRRCG
jgi:uncharacterized protein (DUF2252 family)